MAQVSEEDKVISQLNDQLRASRSSVRNLAQQKSNLIRKVNEYDRAYKQLLSGQAKQQSDIRDQQLTELSQRIREKYQSKNTITKQREQQARQIEDEVKAHLNNLVSIIAGEQTNDISLIQRNYSIEVEYVIRSAVTSAYVVGINYVGGRKKRLHHMFLTLTDIEKIKTLTKEFENIFWRRMSVVLHHTDVVQTILKQARFSHKSTLTLSNLVTSLATKIVTKSIAIATITKVNALRSLPESRIKSAQTVEMLRWITAQDDRVCIICLGYEGQTWQSDDPNIPIPGDESTHLNCRCYLEPSGSEDQALEPNFAGVGE